MKTRRRANKTIDISNYNKMNRYNLDVTAGAGLKETEQVKSFRKINLVRLFLKGFCFKSKWSQYTEYQTAYFNAFLKYWGGDEQICKKIKNKLEVYLGIVKRYTHK